MLGPEGRDFAPAQPRHSLPSPVGGAGSPRRTTTPVMPRGRRGPSRPEAPRSPPGLVVSSSGPGFATCLGFGTCPRLGRASRPSAPPSPLRSHVPPPAWLSLLTWTPPRRSGSSGAGRGPRGRRAAPESACSGAPRGATSGARLGEARRGRLRAAFPRVLPVALPASRDPSGAARRVRRPPGRPVSGKSRSAEERGGTRAGEGRGGLCCPPLVGPRRCPLRPRPPSPAATTMATVAGWAWGWLALLLGVLAADARARRSQDLRCGACRALVDELEWEISRVDPKKTIQMGSFRINPDGSQSVVEVPYARSEAHLTELLERVCEQMKEYGEQPDPGGQRKNYVRVAARPGPGPDPGPQLEGVRLDGDITSSLKFACESIVEEFEDELIEFFSHEAENVKDRLCSKRTDLCDHALHIPHDEL
ncbi:protein canopy homolog 2 [Ornithorhynchus anatinus]|uniref:protein canopy homolog 2 n=1 Tax=Ornithorhynchus anatinus TaxID=9258 RepID=UPI0019D4A166|nr:protein canopy homolog 2 [Ornithorhynchus anatinus]